MFFIEEHRAATELKQLRDPSVIVKPSPPPRMGNRDGDWNQSKGGPWGDRGGGNSGRGGGWRNMADKRVNLQRSDSDFMEEDCTEVLLVSTYM